MDQHRTFPSENTYEGRQDLIAVTHGSDHVSVGILPHKDYSEAVYTGLTVSQARALANDLSDRAADIEAKQIKARAEERKKRLAERDRLIEAAIGDDEENDGHLDDEGEDKHRGIAMGMAGLIAALTLGDDEAHYDVKQTAFERIMDARARRQQKAKR